MRNRNKYNPRLAVHPLGQFTHPRIDIIHGDQDIRIEAGYCEAVEIARQQIATLSNDFGVLFVNLTAPQKQIERDHEYACNARRSDAGSFRHVTFRAGEFASKLGIITQAVVQKRLATVVICGLEFAFQSSRHKKLVVDWLKDLKDHFGRQIIVVSLHQPSNYGLDKTLVQLSDSVSRVGDYCVGEEIEILPDTVKGVDAEEESEVADHPKLDQLEGAEDADVEAISQGAEHVKAVDIETESLEERDVDESVQDETLKNKELDHADV